MSERSMGDGILSTATDDVPLPTQFRFVKERRLCIVYSRHPLELRDRLIALPWALIKQWGGLIAIEEAQQELRASGVRSPTDARGT